MKAPRIRANRYSLMTLEWPRESEPLAHWLKAQREKAPLLMDEIAIVLKPAPEHQPEEIRSAVAALDRLDIGLMGLTGSPEHGSLA